MRKSTDVSLQSSRTVKYQYFIDGWTFWHMTCNSQEDITFEYYTRFRFIIQFSHLIVCVCRSQAGPKSSESVFRQAMNLMSQRCTSVSNNNNEEGRQTPLICLKEPPYGVHAPKVFYVRQNKPVPMPPLKVIRMTMQFIG